MSCHALVRRLVYEQRPTAAGNEPWWTSANRAPPRGPSGIVATTCSSLTRASTETPSSHSPRVSRGDVASGEELQLIEPRNGSWVTSVTLAPDGPTVLVTSIGGRGGTYPCDVCTDIDGLLQLAEERSVRQLTPEERATYLGQNT